AEIGRIYLPNEVLADAGVAPDCASITGAAGLAQARAVVGGWAGVSFEKARAAIPRHERAALAPALAMYGVYRGYYDHMAALNWEFRGPIKLGPLTKIKLGLGPVLFGPGRRGLR
ncbi:MAG: squalene/phytoene synthase family protein, partial [Pseudomonadota bacterium]